MDILRQVADAVLYEGYILWPYRRSAIKNQQRWTFGGVYPRQYSESSGTNDRWQVETQCLIEAAAPAEVEVQTRFLQVVERRVRRGDAEPPEFVDQLQVESSRYLAWQEAREREFNLRLVLRTDPPRTTLIQAERGLEFEPIIDQHGTRVGWLQRSWEQLQGTLQARFEPVADALFRLTIRLSNTYPCVGPREAAVSHALMAAHVVAHCPNGMFVSLTDPPDALRAATAACRNVSLWPVLVGRPGDRRTMLAAPIILYDYPQVSPESPGDLFDLTEIDQMLRLNIAALTDEEKQEMEALDPRTLAILERTTSLSPQQRLRLHGRLRDVPHGGES